MFAKCPGGRTGRIEEDCVKKLFRLVLQHIGLNRFGTEAEPVEIFPKATKTVTGLIQRRHIGARQCKLRGLATRSSTEICDTFTRYVAHKPNRHAGGEILHPPRTFSEAFKRWDLPLEFTQAHAAIRHERTAQFFRPESRISLDRQIN